MMAHASGGAEDTVTLADYLREDDDLTSEAHAVCGAHSTDQCTRMVSDEPLPRQAVFSCLTCKDKTGKRACLCLACSLACHADHELAELWTKRRLRCDCGTSRFPEDVPCSFFQVKPRDSDGNVYNHNFDGLYCRCNRPYPDPEREDDDLPMIQCILCEDWLHYTISDDVHDDTQNFQTDDSEFICRLCTTNHWATLGPYLLATATSCDITSSQQPPARSSTAATEASMSSSASHDTQLDAAATKCQKPALPRERLVKPIPTDGFYRQLREALCSCPPCRETFAQAKLDFLLDSEDTISAYEAQAEAARADEERHIAEDVERSFQALPHVQQIEIAAGMNDFISHMKEAIFKRQASGEQLSSEDVWREMEALRAKRRKHNE